MLKKLIIHMPDNTPGLDGIVKGDLLLLSTEALEWLAKFYTAIEQGAKLPEASCAARMAFLSKGEDDLDPKGFRGLSILSCVYRIWGVATLQRLQGWITTWEKDGLLPAPPSLSALRMPGLSSAPSWSVTSSWARMSLGVVLISTSASIKSAANFLSSSARSVDAPLAPSLPMSPSTASAFILTRLLVGSVNPTTTPAGSPRAAP